MASWRIAVVSPSVDRMHGTERHVTELAERLVRDFGYEVHLYAQRVDGLDAALASGRLIWRRIPRLPGPHLLNYLWWWMANQAARRLHRWRGLRYHLVYSPGVNCRDADVLSVHEFFAHMYRGLRSTAPFSAAPPSVWPRLLHRLLYYRLIAALERRLYSRPGLPLAAISRKTAADVAALYGRSEGVTVVYAGVDSGRFHPRTRAALRSAARLGLGLAEEHAALLLVGNDWRKKGLTVLLEAVAALGHPAVRLLVVGADDRRPWTARITALGLESVVTFHPLRPDVEFYYAAADICVSPSMEEAFSLPPAEAMACGLPVVVSSRAGASEWITHGHDGLVLRDPQDAGELAGHIRRLVESPALRAEMGARAARRAAEFTWERNAAEMERIFRSVLERQGGS